MVARRELAEGLARLAALLGRGDPGDLEAARVQVAGLRQALAAPARREDAVARQLELVLALRLAADAPVKDCPLGCREGLRALVCVARQIQSANELAGIGTKASKGRERTRSGRSAELARHDGKRGRAPSRPSCVTERCVVGAAVRALLGDVPEAVALAARAPRASDTSEG